MSNSSTPGVVNDLAQALLALHNYQRISRQLYDELSKPSFLRAIADKFLGCI